MDVWRELVEKYRALAELAARHRHAGLAAPGAEQDVSARSTAEPAAPRDPMMSDIAQRWPGALREAELVRPEQMAKRGDRVRDLAAQRPTSLASLLQHGDASDREAAAAAIMWSVHRMLARRGEQALRREQGVEPSAPFRPSARLSASTRASSSFSTQVRTLAQASWVELLSPSLVTAVETASPTRAPTQAWSVPPIDEMQRAASHPATDQRSTRLTSTRGAHLVLAAAFGLRIRTLLLLGYEREGRWLAHPADPAWSHEQRGPAEWRLDVGGAER